MQSNHPASSGFGDSTQRGGQMKRSRTGLLLSALLILFSALPALAQSSGRITGTVRDANGAPVGGAPVTVRNQETGASQIVRSASNGAYEAANLAPGLYTVTVDVQGFRPVTLRDQRVGEGAMVSADFSLELRI